MINLRLVDFQTVNQMPEEEDWKKKYFVKISSKILSTFFVYLDIDNQQKKNKRLIFLTNARIKPNPTPDPRRENNTLPTCMGSI